MKQNFLEVKHQKVSGFYREFLSPEKYDFFDDFELSHALIDGNDDLFYVLSENKLVGIAALHKKNDKLYETILIETKKNYKNNGVGVVLVKAIINFLKNENAKLINSKYTKEGELFIKDVFERLAKEGSVELLKHN